MAKKAKAAKAEVEITEHDEAERFLYYLPMVQECQAELKAAEKTLKQLLAAAANEGFIKSDFQYATELQAANGEVKAKTKIARKLKIASFLGTKLGQQYDLFIDPAPQRVSPGFIPMSAEELAAQQEEASKH